MKKLIALLTVILFACCALQARQPELRFRKDGTFKIAQFTDTHIRTSLPKEAADVYARMDHLITVEKPDLVVLTGDIITVKPAAPEWTRLVKFLDDHKVPWCLVYGNHDAEQDLSRADMSAIIASGKYSLNTLNGKGELVDVELEILSSDGGGGAFYVFCMDSHDYSYIFGERVYGWFSQEQVQWLRNCCTARTDAKGKVAPALAFFHIPLPEYIDAWADREDPRRGSASASQSIGIRGENIACGGLNTGMFAAMRETGSVVGTSVGHDHDSDFIAVYRGLALCYGRYTGSNTVYNHLPHGARFFCLHEGFRGFDTWIHEDDDRMPRHVRFDGTALTEAPRDRSKSYGIWSEFDK